MEPVAEYIGKGCGIYQHLLLKKDLKYCLNNSFDIDLDDEFISKIIYDITLNEETYINRIEKNLKDWSFSRLCLIDQAILLLSISELSLEINDKAVIINEAIILSKKFSEEDSYRYINGVLDRL